VSSDILIKIPKPRLAAWLMEPMRANRSTYWKVALAAVFINMFGLLTSLFTMTVYDRVVPNNATSSLIALTIGFAIVVIFDFILKLLRAYFVDHAGAQIDRDIGDSVFQRMLAMRLELKKGSTGALAGLMRELEALRDFFASATLSAVGNAQACRSTANSSPPRRAARSIERIRASSSAAMSRSSWSPAAWPAASLTALKPSRST